jgi:hypothetical protein
LAWLQRKGWGKSSECGKREAA